MKVEIWSDIMCPFCYIGKRRFEEALRDFAGREQIEVEWKSYQLMPEMKSQPGQSLNEFLAAEKGMSLEQAEAMNARVAQMGQEVGVHFEFDKALPANTFKAHKLLHAAKAAGKQNEVGESLFGAYFVEGRNIDDNATLLELGQKAGLSQDQVEAALETASFDKDVQADIYEASQLGVRGVPFFLLNGKYAISGAQPREVFGQALEQAFSEWKSAGGPP